MVLKAGRIDGLIMSQCQIWVTSMKSNKTLHSMYSQIQLQSRYKHDLAQLLF